MKTAAEIKTEIIDFAKDNPHIRAAVLNGSRANSHISGDDLQDFDVRFIVDNFTDFIKDSRWTEQFGEKLIEQQPILYAFFHNLANRNWLCYMTSKSLLFASISRRFKKTKTVAGYLSKQ